MVSGDTSGLAPFSASQELAMMRGSDQSYEMSDEMRSIRVMGGFVILKGTYTSGANAIKYLIS